MKRELTLIVCTTIMLLAILSEGRGKLHSKRKDSKDNYSPTTIAEFSELHPKEYLHILRLARQLQPRNTRRHRQTKLHDEGKTDERDGVKECKAKEHKRAISYQSEHKRVKRSGITWTRSDYQGDAEHKPHISRVWDNWGTWSKCTVTCGVGKLVRCGNMQMCCSSIH